MLLQISEVELSLERIGIWQAPEKTRLVPDSRVMWSGLVSHLSLGCSNFGRSLGPGAPLNPEHASSGNANNGIHTSTDSRHFIESSM